MSILSTLQDIKQAELTLVFDDKGKWLYKAIDNTGLELYCDIVPSLLKCLAWLIAHNYYDRHTGKLIKYFNPHQVDMTIRGYVD